VRPPFNLEETPPSYLPSNHQSEVSKMLIELFRFVLTMLTGSVTAVAMTHSIDPAVMLQGSLASIVLTLLWMTLVVGLLSRGVASMVVSLIFGTLISGPGK